MLLNRICVATSEIRAENIAEKLAQEGHRVTILYLEWNKTEPEKIQEWTTYYNALGIDFIFLTRTEKTSVKLYAALSYEAFLWLKENEKKFDRVYFSLGLGLGYYSVLAKHQGICFRQIEFYLDVDRPTLWKKSNHSEFINQIDDLEIDFMERELFRFSDEIQNGDPSILNWIQENQWKFPGEKPVEVMPTVLPLVSVCIPTYNRPAFLAKTLESIRAQDYPNIEVVLVDDGSPLVEAQTFLDSLEPEFKNKNWKIIRKENHSPGAARNTAVKHAKGEYLLLMDDDNYAKPEEISLFVKVAKKTKADILTCVFIPFCDEKEIASGVEKNYWVPLGASTMVGIYRDCFGDTNSLVKRTVYEEIGGFVEVRGGTCADWEFFSRAILKGFTLEVVPLPLYWYRIHSNSIMTTMTPRRKYESHIRILHNYIEYMPLSLQQLVLHACGQYIKIEEMINEMNEMKENEKIKYQELMQYQHSISWRITAPLRFVKKLFKPIFGF